MFEQNIALSPGTENFTSHTLEIVIMLLGAFILGFLLRHLLNWGKQNIDNYKLEINNWKSKYNGVSSDFAGSISKIEVLENEILSLRNRTEEGPALRVKIGELEREISRLSIGTPNPEPTNELKQKLDECNALNASLHNKIKSLQANIETESEEIKTEENEVEITNLETNIPTPQIVAEKHEIEIPEEIKIVQSEIIVEPIIENQNIRKDDLRKIEGIGPKIASILNDKGIYTFAHLALSSEEKLKAILCEQGDHYKIHEPGTWPEQAALALKGEWEQLFAWQKELKGGKKK